MENALKKGRNGKGTVFIWAAGNGTNKYQEVDNSNYDAQANFHGVIAVCAVDKKGKRAAYSELGSNLWACAPSSATANLMGGEMVSLGNSGKITSPATTDNFGGTSAAAALVGGVVALMLEVNPNLTWRDVKIILAQTARKNDSDDKNWKFNGYHFVSHNYGFGVVETAKAVRVAKTWRNVPAIKIYKSPMVGAGETIGVQNSGINYIEFVDIFVGGGRDHPLQKITDTSNTTISLISPTGTI